MWKTRLFKTNDAMQQWISANGHKMQYQIIYINNAYGLEFKPLLRVY